MSDSSEFEGRSVTSTALVIRGLEGGLRKAMKVKPTTLHVGDKIYTLTESTVVGVSHTVDSDDDSMVERVHIAKASTIAIVDRDFALGTIEEQREAEGTSNGEDAIPFDADSIEDLPTAADLELMGNRSELIIAGLPVVEDVAPLRRMLVAEAQVHNGRARRPVAQAIEARIGEIEAAT